MPTTQPEIGQYLTPEVARMSENVCGLVFPFLLFSILPSYRKFSSAPDTSDLSYEDRDEKDESSEPPHCVTRIR